MAHSLFNDLMATAVVAAIIPLKCCGEKEKVFWTSHCRLSLSLEIQKWCWKVNNIPVSPVTFEWKMASG